MPLITSASLRSKDPARRRSGQSPRLGAQQAQSSPTPAKAT
jgi:hypothetical protein